MKKIIPILFLILLLATACGGHPADLPAIPSPEPAQPTVALSPELTPVTAVAAPDPAVTAPTVAPPVPTPLPVGAMPIPTPQFPLTEFYTIESGDTLSWISYVYDISLEDLAALNGLDPETAVIQEGQTLRVPLLVDRTGPLVTLLPDSEVVYSPAYVDFNTEAFIQAQGGFLATQTTRVDGVELSAGQAIDLLARRFSVGPRVLLALLEYYGGWVTQAQPSNFQPAGPACPHGENLYLQLGWAAARINEGYYGYKQNGSIAVVFKDRSRAIVPGRLNAGTVGVMNLLAVNSDWETWQTELGADGFMKTYRRLFGDPAALAVEPLVPANLVQPEMRLPWEKGKTFYYTGGPHAAYVDGSAWAAIDFGPPDVLGSCYYSEENMTAAAAGKVLLGNKGELYLDLDGDGNLQTGWVLLYLHLVANDNLAQGQMVKAGEPLGVASCEGGAADAAHLHFARRYNGEWMPAGGPVPMVLSGWEVKNGAGQYEGGMVRRGETKTACECWDENMNGLVGE